MAQKITVSYTSDLSGEPEASTVAVRLAFDIDLTEAEKRALDDFLAPYRRNGRKPQTVSADQSAQRATPAKIQTRAGRERLRVIREWLKANGFELSDRGRIPQDMLNAYEAKRPNIVQVPKPEPVSIHPEPVKRRQAPVKAVEKPAEPVKPVKATKATPRRAAPAKAAVTPPVNGATSKVSRTARKAVPPIQFAGV